MSGTKKDFSKYPLANKFYILNELTTPTNVTNTSKAFVNPPYVNSLYYDKIFRPCHHAGTDHLINDGGSFNNGRNTKFNGCTTDNDKQQQNPLYNMMAFSTPLFLPTSSAWPSPEDLTTLAIVSDTTSEQSEKSPTIDTEKGQKKVTLYKGEMCRNWEERGSCRYGSKCQFAHSETELRKVHDHPKYKTEICKTFWQNGTCPYGNRCCFIHNDKERIPKKRNSADNNKERILKKRNSADNVKNSNKKEKSKGLSKYGSDPSLYGSYHLSDSSNTSILSPPAVTAPSSSINEFLVAFADAYFSPNVSLSPEAVVSSNVSSPSANCDDETVIGLGNSSVNSTPTKKKVST